MKIIQPTLPAHVKLVGKGEPDCGQIFCDPTQIYQILMNLVINAIHAFEDRAGEISYGVEHVACAEDCKDEIAVEEGDVAKQLI